MSVYQLNSYRLTDFRTGKEICLGCTKGLRSVKCYVAKHGASTLLSHDVFFLLFTDSLSLVGI